ncbi:MAG: hypothetical protein JSW41_00920 [Candidatus Aenigmatarchaeota archaeon]|nr:MAG: hypothetical protein JSW41_00920 [Candidatus Aenigmarchaeota archaeon]
MARKSWTKEQIEALKKSMRLHIDARINALLRDAHKLGYGKKEAIDAVVESLLFEIVGDENIPDVFKTSRGQDTLKSFIKSEVSVIIKERRKGWAERYKKIMTSDYSSEVKRKNIEKLEKYYFGKEEMEEIRKKEEEKRKRKREFEDFTMEERARILREKGKERRERILEGLEDVEEGPWTREGFEGLSLAEKERLREEWYKKRRKEYKRKKKKYKEEHGAGRRFAFWKKDEELRKAREKLGKEKGKLGKYRDIAYGEANPEKVEEYEGKKREYKEFKDKLRTGEIYKDMGIAEARQRELELKKEVKELRKEAKGKRWKRAARFAGRTAAGPGKFAKGAKSLVMKGFVLACFVGFGAVVTVAIGLPFVFFLGFL